MYSYSRQPILAKLILTNDIIIILTAQNSKDLLYLFCNWMINFVFFVVVFFRAFSLNEFNKGKICNANMTYELTTQ